MSPPFLELGLFGVIAAGLFGAVVGSFLNVLIHRLPRGESLVRPGSHCPACGAPVRAKDNVPVLSWLLLRGRCRICRVRISPRYPAVELANAVLWALVFWRAPTLPDFFSGAFLVSACLALLFVDAEFFLLPDVLTLTGVAVGIGLSFFSAKRTPVQSVAGAALGAGALFLLGYLWEKLRGVEGMGLGDVKMLGMIGAFLGPSGVLVTVLLASLLGSVVGLALIVMRRGNLQMRLPFGVFLALGAIAALFVGSALVERYRSLWPS
jgi:leader peptidase (prepilin peptidase) / N-methyltransferase